MSYFKIFFLVNHLNFALYNYQSAMDWKIILNDPSPQTVREAVREGHRWSARRLTAVFSSPEKQGKWGGKPRSGPEYEGPWAAVTFKCSTLLTSVIHGKSMGQWETLRHGIDSGSYTNETGLETPGVPSLAQWQKNLPAWEGHSCMKVSQ